MPVRAVLQPTGPYSLRLSGLHASDATRIVGSGTYRATIRVGDRLERVHAVQRPNGAIIVAADTDAGVAQVRFTLGLADDHSEFLARFADDPLLGESVRRLRGLRPMRTGTVAQALLRAVSGQLIRAGRAREIERTIVRAVAPSLGGLHAPPTAAELGGLSPAQLERFGLGARRGAALVRLCRGLDLEALRHKPSRDVAARLRRERGLGPWSVGVVSIQGLGSYEHGLARDLGLVKLASRLWGRRVEPEETDGLLAPYGEWAGLASVYLLAGAARGLVRFDGATSA